MATADDNQTYIYVISGVFGGVSILFCILITVLFSAINTLKARTKILEGSFEQIWAIYAKKGPGLLINPNYTHDDISTRGFHTYTGKPGPANPGQQHYPGTVSSGRQLGQQ